MEIKSNQGTTLNNDLFEMLPESLKVLLKKIKQQHYEELYEPEADGNSSLQDALQEVLEAFGESDNKLCHRRYVWMGLIWALVVEPTVEYYQPNSDLTRNIINLLVIDVSQESILLNRNKGETASIEIAKNNVVLTQQNLATQEVKNFQAVNEALDVFYNAIRLLESEQSVEALLEILDDCLEGYAIFPGFTGRREVFEWWIDEVVPASWFLLPPKSFYVVDGLPNREEIKIRQSKKLEKISWQVQLMVACQC